MHQIHTLVESPSGGQPMALDLSLKADGTQKPLVIQLHGFKGFKDFGAFPLLPAPFVEKGFIYAKFNFSHSGTTPSQPEQFADLKAFKHNTLSKELADTQAILNYILEGKIIPPEEIDMQRIYLLGYSRGGTVAIISALEDQRIKKVVAFAPLVDPENLWAPDLLKKWEEEGEVMVRYRWTGQELPMAYDFAEDFILHGNKYRLRERLAELTQELLVFQGTADETVPAEQAEHVKNAAKARLELIEGGDHRFGMTQPWPEAQLPEPFAGCIAQALTFYQG